MPPEEHKGCSQCRHSFFDEEDNAMTKTTLPWLLILAQWCIIPQSTLAGTVSVFFAKDRPQHSFAAGDIKAALEAKHFTVNMKDLSALSEHFAAAKADRIAQVSERCAGKQSKTD